MSLYKLFFLTSCLSVIYVMHAIAEDKHVSGEIIHEYELATPKPGFVGGPPTAAAMRPWMPRDQSDFCTRYLRVTKITERELPDLRRIVFRIDEINNTGSIAFIGRMRMEGVYFIYIDISPEGTAILKKTGDDNSTGEDFGGTKFSLPFPFNCARSPALGFKDGEMDGCAEFWTLG